jgi:hypothetical protein
MKTTFRAFTLLALLLTDVTSALAQLPPEARGWVVEGAMDHFSERARTR